MIEVGEYVINQNRLVIGQIIEINEERQEAIIKVKRLELLIGFWNIKKHSKNIIDLIEIGDFVNGHRVVEIKNDEEKVEIGLENEHLINYYIEEQEIKSILTKEQYQLNCYVVEGENNVKNKR